MKPYFSDFRTYRLLSCRNFTLWIHGKLGPGVKRTIPPCVVNEIRKQLPEETRTHMGLIPGGEDRMVEAEI